MIPFTTFEIMLSVISASVFGAIFAFFDTILKILSLEFNHVKRIREHVLGSGSFFSLPKRADFHKDKSKESYRYLGEISTFAKVIIFIVGFILLSYYSLDGAVRLYLLLFGIGFFILFRGISDKTLLRIVDAVFCFLYGIFVICLRLVCRPFMFTVKKISNYFSKRRQN